jgi:DNA-binding GntR family transcriptional regulator
LINLRDIPTREKAFNILLDAIITGRLGAGERLIEDSLAAQFGVSRTPLREALHKLELEGFVVRLPHRGVMVAEISATQAQELSEVRSTLEGLATRLTADRITEQEVKELLIIKQKIQAAGENKSYELFRESNEEFHNFIRVACKNKVCSDHLTRLYQHLQRYRNISILHAPRQERAIEEHLKIVDLVIAKRGETAELIMRNHIINSFASISETLKKF